MLSTRFQLLLSGGCMLNFSNFSSYTAVQNRTINLLYFNQYLVLQYAVAYLYLHRFYNALFF